MSKKVLIFYIFSAFVAIGLIGLFIYLNSDLPEEYNNQNSHQTVNQNQINKFEQAEQSNKNNQKTKQISNNNLQTDNNKTIIQNKEGDSIYIIKNWVVFDKSNNDKKDISILKDAEITHELSEYFRDRGFAHLVIRCKEKKTEFFIDFDRKLPKSYVIDYEYVIDNQEKVSTRGGFSSTDEAIFIREPIEFIVKIMDAKRIWIKVPLEDKYDYIETYFSLDGLPEAIELIRDACYW
jgi:hypothetical protein